MFQLFKEVLGFCPVTIPGILGQFSSDHKQLLTKHLTNCTQNAGHNKLQLPSECSQWPNRIFINTNDKLFQHLDNVILPIMSFPIWKSWNIKSDSLQFASYFKVFKSECYSTSASSFPSASLGSDMSACNIKGFVIMICIVIVH